MPSESILALHVETVPQFRETVYESGDPLEHPYAMYSARTTVPTWWYPYRVSREDDSMRWRIVTVLVLFSGSGIADETEPDVKSKGVQETRLRISFRMSSLIESISVNTGETRTVRVGSCVCTATAYAFT